MYARRLPLLLLLLLSALPLAAQETLVVTGDGSAPAFTCVEADCGRLAWLPAGAGVTVNGQVEGRELEGSALWYEVLLDCPCFDYEHRYLDSPPAIPLSEQGTWTLWQPRWSADGSRIAGAAGSDLYVWDAAAGVLLAQESFAPFTLLYPTWSPVGAQMVLTGLDQERQKSLLLLLDANGHVLQPLNGNEGWTTAAAWSPDGSRIAAVGDALRIWDATQGQPLLAVETFATAFHWSPDGRRIVTGNHREEAAQVWDASTGELLFILEEEVGGHLDLVAWSPDGARLFTLDVMAGTLNVYDATDGHRVSSLAEGDSGLVYDAQWSTDGEHILYAPTGDRGGKLKRWSGHEQDPPYTLFDSDEGILGLSLSPDGRFLAAGIENVVRIVDTTDGRLLADLWRPDSDAQPWFIGLVAWSPDGLRVAAAETVFGQRSPVGQRNSVAHVWNLTLIPAGPTRAFIHSRHLGDA